MSARLLRRAVSAYQAGDLAGAAGFCLEIDASAPQRDRALQLLATISAGNGDLVGALGYFQQALVLRPGDLELLDGLARSAMAIGAYPQALEALEQLAAANPQALDYHVMLAEAALAAGQLKRSGAACDRARAMAPDDAAVLALAAVVAERCNDDELAADLAERALSLAPERFRPWFVRARVLEKRGRDDAANTAFEAALAHADTPVNRSLALARLGHIADSDGRYEAAFSFHERANAELLPRAAALGGSSVYGLQVLEELEAFLTPPRLKRWSDAPRDGANDGRPVFLVGFPRSGTTLLDRVLVAHPDVTVVEEKETLGPLLARYAGTPGALASLDAVGVDEQRDAQAIYRERLALEGAPADGLVVDKLPLNSLHLAMIYRLFPRARVLYAVRDPRDVCLSCFFQSFGLNEAMSQFLTWRGTVAFYARVQALARRALEGLPIRHAFVRYEDITADLEAGLRPALALLGIRWHPSMGSFDQAARHNEVDTPSYDQVVKPLYRSSVGRWRRYGFAMDRVDGQLAPWIRHFGYADTTGISETTL